MCYIFLETQQHLIKCHVIKENLKDKIDFKKIDYSYLTGSEAQQEMAAKIYTQILHTREEILAQRCDSSPNGAHSTCKET